MDKARSDRKDEHVKLVVESHPTLGESGFDDLSFVHRSLPEAFVEGADLTSGFGTVRLPVPLYINAMTGGSEFTGRINESLARIAAELNLALAVGSERAAIVDPTLADTYRVVRRNHPTGVIFANIGADAPVDFAMHAVSLLEANALQIHLNAPQELVMPEGESDFRGWLKNIELAVRHVEVPVIVKESGFGMSRETLAVLADIGVCHVDVSGRGGTNFVSIENRRRARGEYTFLESWGQTTVVSLLESIPLQKKLDVLASGGIRNPLDAVKCLALGATAVGLAGRVLRQLEREGEEAVIDEMRTWLHQIRGIMALLGANRIADLRGTPVVVTGKTREWCELRGVNVATLARGGREGCLGE